MSTRPYTALVHPKHPLVVRGTKRSVELVLADARRNEDQRVAFLTDAGLRFVDPMIPFQLRQLKIGDRG